MPYATLIKEEKCSKFEIMFLRKMILCPQIIAEWPPDLLMDSVSFVNP